MFEKYTHHMTEGSHDASMAGLRSLVILSLFILAVFQRINGKPNFIVMLMDDVSIGEYFEFCVM